MPPATSARMPVDHRARALDDEARDLAQEIQVTAISQAIAAEAGQAVHQREACLDRVQRRDADAGRHRAGLVAVELDVDTDHRHHRDRHVQAAAVDVDGHRARTELGFVRRARPHQRQQDVGREVIGPHAQVVLSPERVAPTGLDRLRLLRRRGHGEPHAVHDHVRCHRQGTGGRRRRDLRVKVAARHQLERIERVAADRQLVCLPALPRLRPTT